MPDQEGSQQSVPGQNCVDWPGGGDGKDVDRAFVEDSPGGERASLGCAENSYPKEVRRG